MFAGSDPARLALIFAAGTAARTRAPLFRPTLFSAGKMVALARTSSATQIPEYRACIPQALVINSRNYFTPKFAPLHRSAKWCSKKRTIDYFPSAMNEQNRNIPCDGIIIAGKYLYILFLLGKLGRMKLPFSARKTKKTFFITAMSSLLSNKISKSFQTIMICQLVKL